MTVTPADLDSLATFYLVCSRTIRRWIAAGVDVRDPVEVGAYLASQHHVADPPLEAVIDELERELATLSNDEH